MQYITNDDLPTTVRRTVMLDAPRSLFRHVLNKALEGGLSEPRAFARAHASLERAGYMRNNRGQYVSIGKAAGLNIQFGGVMVVFYLPAELAAQVAYPYFSEPPETGIRRYVYPDALHITLCYLGKLADLDLRKLGKCADNLRKVATNSRPVKAALAGLGRFEATEHSDYMDVVYMNVASPQLMEFRERVVNAVETAGLKVSRDFEYRPHVTLAYATQDSPMPRTHVTGLNVEFGAVELCIGNARQRFEFQSKGTEGVEGTDKRFDHYSDHAERLALEFGENVDMPFEWIGNIEKLDEERRLAFGWFSVIYDDKGKQVVDSQGDLIDEDELEKAVYKFVLDSRKAGEIHRKDEDGKAVNVGRLVETIVFTAEKKTALGIEMDKVGWWGGFYVDNDDVWEKVKSGKYKCFSIGGTGRRVNA